MDVPRKKHEQEFLDAFDSTIPDPPLDGEEWPDDDEPATLRVVIDVSTKPAPSPQLTLFGDEQ
jgi:hypothetical protein